MILVDTHCHLNFNIFHNDLPEVIARAHDKGVERILIPGTDLESSRRGLELCYQYSGLYAAVGFHPNDGSTWSSQAMQEMQKLSKDPKVVAIGEIGLDYYRNRTPVDLQREMLQFQLGLAVDEDLPVILHCRQAMDDLWPILTQWYAGLSVNGSNLIERPGVLHSFEGNLDWARKAIDLHFRLGLGGPITYQNARIKQQLAAVLPLESILLETDAPFLSPSPLRGQRNEPANILIIAGKIASLKNIDISRVAEATSKCADRLFLWSSF